MGERFDKVWADGWEQAKPIIDDAFAGRSRRFVDLPWTLGTDRGEAETWWTFSYSRVLDGEGRVAGLFILTNETTAQVVATRRLRESEAIARRTSSGSSWRWRPARSSAPGSGTCRTTASPSTRPSPAASASIRLTAARA